MTNETLEDVLGEILEEEGNDVTVEKLRDKIEMVKRFVDEWYNRKPAGTDLTREDLKHRVVEFGSCALTPNYRATDVDLLLMGTKIGLTVSAESDFEEFILTCPGISCVSRCEGSRFTPTLVRFKLDRFSVDLQFARVGAEALEEDYSLNRDWSQEMVDGVELDGNSLMSLRAVAVSRKIKELVPRLETFRLLLRVVKRWALRRAIYKHKFGYPGGIAFTILVAKVCQVLDPKGEEPTRWLFEQFFVYCDQQTWGEKNPIFLGNYAPLLKSKDYMQVYTPEENAWNCTHNVNNSTLPVIKREFGRAARLVLDFRNQGKGLRDVVYTLCDKDDFFTEFPLYIQFKCYTQKGDDYFEDYTIIALRTFCSNLDLLLKDHWHILDEEKNTTVFARLYPFASKHEKGYSPQSELHAYWIGSWLSQNEFHRQGYVSDLVDQFHNMMQKTHERQQRQVVWPVAKSDLPKEVFPKPWSDWGGFLSQRASSWKHPTQALSPPALEQRTMTTCYPHYRGTVIHSPINPSSLGYRSVTPFLQINSTRQQAQSHHGPRKMRYPILHKAIEPQQTNPGINPHYNTGAASNNRHNKPTQNKKYNSQPSQYQGQRSQFQNNAQIQSNSPIAGGGRRRWHPGQSSKRNSRISQQEAEMPLPVVTTINKARALQPSHVHSDYRDSESRTQMTERVHRQHTPDVTTTFPTGISSRVGKNPNGKTPNNWANPNNNKTPSPEPVMKRSAYNNPNRHPSMNVRPKQEPEQHVVSSSRDIEDDRSSVRTDADVGFSGRFVETHDILTARANRPTRYVYNGPMKSTTSKWIPKDKLIPRRKRNPPAEDSPPGTPEQDSSSEESDEGDNSDAVPRRGNMSRNEETRRTFLL